MSTTSAPTTDSSGSQSIPSAFDATDDSLENYTEPTFDYGDDDDAPAPQAKEPPGGDGPSAAKQQQQQQAAVDDDGDEPAAPEPKADAAKKEPEAPVYSSEILSEAKRYGFDPKLFPNEEQLSLAIRAMDTQVLNWGKQAAGQNQPAQQTQPAQQPAAKAPQAPQPQPEPTGEFEFKLPARDMMDPDLYDALDGMHKHYQRRDAEREQRIASLEDNYRQSQELATAQMSDAFFEGLGEEFASLFGQGPTSELSPDAPEFLNRDKVLEAADLLEAGYRSRGQRPPSDKVLLRKALDLTFSDQTKQIVRNEINGQLRNRRGQFTNKPTQRRAQPLTGEAAQIAAMRDRMAKNGFQIDDADDDDDDGTGIY